jgi:hypothetical protein
VVAAEVNRQRSSIKHAEDATPLGFWVLSQRHPGQDPGRPKGNHAAEEPAADLTWRSWIVSMEYLIGRLNWFTTWLDGYSSSPPEFSRVGVDDPEFVSGAVLGMVQSRQVQL